MEAPTAQDASQRSSDRESVPTRRQDASASTGYEAGAYRPAPLAGCSLRAAREPGFRRARPVPEGARGPSIKALAGDEAGEARWHASDLEGVHHVSILVDGGSRTVPHHDYCLGREDAGQGGGA